MIAATTKLVRMANFSIPRISLTVAAVKNHTSNWTGESQAFVLVRYVALLRLSTIPSVMSHIGFGGARRVHKPEDNAGFKSKLQPKAILSANMARLIHVRRCGHVYVNLDIPRNASRDCQ